MGPHLLLAVAVVVGAYLLGSLPTALAVGRRVGVAPDRDGSANPGASNVTRLAGRRAGLVVLVVDAAKGAVAVALGDAVGGTGLAVAALAAAVAGHVWPVGRWRRGGKGVATLLGGAAVLWPVATVAAVAAWVTSAAIARRASLASLAAVAVLTVGVAASRGLGREVAAVAVLSTLVAVRHRRNVGRLLRGEERRLGATSSLGARGHRRGR